MARNRTASIAVAAATAMLLTLTACSGGADPGADTDEASTGNAGGTLYVLNATTVQTWDPQRNAEAAVAGFFLRTVYRTLTTIEPSTGDLVGDLADDTGEVSEDGKTWTFSLRDDAFWQDGEPVTCDDVKYGISRTFAIDQITGGSTYALRFLDIPKDAEGKSVYKGPYSGEGSEHFDKAISCDGNDVTFALANPHFDFNYTLTTGGFVPYRQDQDEGAKSLHSVFSNGPYMLKDEWKSGSGGTFVRNPHWKAASHDVRLGLPDEIVFEEGLSEDAPVQRIIASSGRDATAITMIPATPAQQPLILKDEALKDRTVRIERTGIDFLQPNFRSPVTSDPVIREALAVSTNRVGYSQALGAEELYPTTFSMLHHSLPGFTDKSPFGEPVGGDPKKARALLEDAGIALPVTVNVAYKKTVTSDKSMAALAEGWKAAGFDVQLHGIADNYYGVAASPASADKYDLFWNLWGTAWPSAATILPTVFDSRINLSEAGSRLDYGYFDDAEINAKMDATALIIDDLEREKAWGDISAEIARKGGYIALTGQAALLPLGKSVDIGNASRDILGQLDIAEISVQ